MEKEEENFRVLAYTNGYIKVNFTQIRNTGIQTYVGQKYSLGKPGIDMSRDD